MVRLTSTAAIVEVTPFELSLEVGGRFVLLQALLKLIDNIGPVGASVVLSELGCRAVRV